MKDSKKFAVIGSPIKHSLSPKIHQIFASKLGIEISYQALPIEPEEFETSVEKLFDEGFGHRILLSQDVFIKMMLKSYGGNGYSYILKYFKDRLIRSGLSEDQFVNIMTVNPRTCFEALN